MRAAPMMDRLFSIMGPSKNALLEINPADTPPHQSW